MLVLAHLHRSVLTQQVHSLGHLAFKWRSSFAKALAKLSPNFREKSPNSFYKMIHIYKINTKYKYLQCNLDMCTWTFAKTLARKKNLSPFQKKTLAETVNCIPKGLCKGNPFHGPFAQLSYIYIYIVSVSASSMDPIGNASRTCTHTVEMNKSHQITISWVWYKNKQTNKQTKENVTTWHQSLKLNVCISSQSWSLFFTWSSESQFTTLKA